MACQILGSVLDLDAEEPLRQDTQDVGDNDRQYDARRDGNDLVIVDAAEVTGKPLCTISLPQRVLFGFHGTCLPE